MIIKRKDAAPMKVSEAPIALEEGMRQVFASYHLRTEDNTQSGFGNIVANFYPEQYANQIDKFILELQKSIEMANEAKFGKKFVAQVLFFR